MGEGGGGKLLAAPWDLQSKHTPGVSTQFCPEHNESMVNIKVVPSRYRFCELIIIILIIIIIIIIIILITKKPRHFDFFS